MSYSLMAKKNPYDSYSDRDLVDAILSGNEQAAIYLIYNRYYSNLRFWCYSYCRSQDEYIDDLCQEVYVLLKGKNGDWQPLSSWAGISSFRTWFNTIVDNWFKNKPDYLIGFRKKKLYSEKEDDVDPVELVEAPQPTIEENMQKVFMLEAINNLKNKDQRLVILKELQGYSHEEIAEILNQVRRAEGRIKINKEGKEILADAATVDVLKQRAVAELKKALGVKRKKI